jgi:prepilin-type cleavage/methylation N-terminal domain protein
MKQNKGFTIVEVLVCLVLACLLMLAVSAISAYTSELAVSQRTEESLTGLAVTSIEESNLALRTSKKLNCKKTVTTGELGSFEYSLIKNIEALDYTNAYRVSISVTANTGESISQEVILYAQE